MPMSTVKPAPHLGNRDSVRVVTDLVWGLPRQFNFSEELERFVNFVAAVSLSPILMSACSMAQAQA